MQTITSGLVRVTSPSPRRQGPEQTQPLTQGELTRQLHHPQGPLPCVVHTHRGGALHAHVAWGRALYWGGLLEAPARQLHAHRQEDLQLLGRGPPNLGDEEEAEVLQVRLLELVGAVLRPYSLSCMAPSPQPAPYPFTCPLSLPIPLAFLRSAL